MKKKIIWFLVIIMILGVFTACGEKGKIKKILCAHRWDVEYKNAILFVSFKDDKTYDSSIAVNYGKDKYKVHGEYEIKPDYIICKPYGHATYGGTLYIKYEYDATANSLKLTLDGKAVNTY